MSRGGFVLPLVLVLLVAASGIGVVALLVARTEVALEGGDFRYARDRLRWADVVAADPIGGAPGTLTTTLGHGFVLSRSGAGPGPGHHHLSWVPDPDALAATLPHGVEVGWGPPESGVVPGDASCGPVDPGGLVRVRGPEPEPGPDPPLPPPPRLGPVGTDRLARRAHAWEGPALPDPRGDAPLLASAPDGARLHEGAGMGVLVVPGSLMLAGSVRWEGLVIVAGDLDLAEGARLVGAALVGGRLRIHAPALLEACPLRASEALAAPALAPPFPVPAARELGRF